MLRSIALASVLLVALSPVSSVAQSILYVHDTATGADNGSNWCDAYLFLQDALLTPV